MAIRTVRDTLIKAKLQEGEVMFILYFICGLCALRGDRGVTTKLSG